MKSNKIFLIAALIFGSFAGIAQIQDINIGTTVNDRTGDPLRTVFTKTNSNFDYLDAKATASGTDTYTATISPAITSYVTGQRYFITFTNANTGAATLNLNALGAKAIKISGTTALASGDIGAGQTLETYYDGTNLQILGSSGGSDFLSFNPQTDNYTLLLSDAFKLVAVSKATAVTLTVPPNSSAAFSIGTTIYLKRTGVGILTIVQDVGVTVTGSSGALTDPGLNVIMTLIKTGTNTWDLQNGSPGSYTSYVPTFTGFSVDPTPVVARYSLIGKMCHVVVTMGGNGTSNAATFTMTLPFAGASEFTQGQFGVLPTVVNNGAIPTTPGRITVNASSNIATLSPDASGAVWSGGLGKRAFVNLSYEID